VLWSPGSKYEIFLPALEKTLERRAKPYPPKAGETGGDTAASKQR
jgi:hypothetical protein